MFYRMQAGSFQLVAKGPAIRTESVTNIGAGNTNNRRARLM